MYVQTFFFSLSSIFTITIKHKHGHRTTACRLTFAQYPERILYVLDFYHLIFVQVDRKTNFYKRATKNLDKCGDDSAAGRRILFQPSPLPIRPEVMLIVVVLVVVEEESMRPIF